MRIIGLDIHRAFAEAVSRPFSTAKRIYKLRRGPNDISVLSKSFNVRRSQSR